LAVIAEEQHQRQQEEYQDPLSVFIYALKAPETKRQWPRRLKVFFDFLKLEEPIEEQGKISEATVPNYYKAIKLFCEMNDIVFNWKKITRGMPRVRQAACRIATK
jgi:hypothetical protein